jgi:hypothetical protein
MKPKQIICAKCNKPVDKLEWFTDWMTDQTVIRVYCHGTYEEMKINLSTLSYEALKNLEDAQGIAFEKQEQIK